MTEEIKNILLVGRTGAGKSALANVISGTKDFKESAGSVSETAETKARKFKMNYQVIDTIGFQDTTLEKKEELLSKFRNEVEKYICEGIFQILLVVDKRFTKNEIDDFNWFSSYLFDDKVFDYTTIVRTHFPNFEDDNECKSDIKALIESSKDEDIKKVLSEGRIIYVDNSSEKSRNKLLKYMFERDSERMNNYKPMTSKSIKNKFDSLKIEIGSLLSTIVHNVKDYFGGLFSSNLSEQQLLSKKLEELIELKEKMEAGKLINKDLEKRDSKISELISKFKDRLDEEEKEILDRLLDVQKEIAKAVLEGEEKLELERKLGSLKRKLENKLPKYEVDDLLYEKELITRSLILSGELEINERRQLQQEIIKYSAIIGLKDIRNKRGIKDLLSEEWLLKKFELENDDDSVSDDDSISSVSFESFEKAKKIDLIMRIGEKTLELKRLMENIGFNKETQILLEMLLSAQEKVLKKGGVAAKQEKNDLQQKLMKQGGYNRLIRILKKNEEVIKLKNQLFEYEEKESPFNYLNLQKYLDKLYPTKESKKEVKEIAIDFYENPIEVVGGGKLILQGYHDLKELIIDGDYLKSKLTELDVSDCYNLELLHCIENELISVNLINNKKLKKLTIAYNQLNGVSFLKYIPCPQGLVHLNISNNNIQENGLEFLKDFVNLEVLSLGNYDEGFSNNFTGSLESLKKLTKLKVLNIKNSGIEGVEDLVDPTVYID